MAITPEEGETLPAWFIVEVTRDLPALTERNWGDSNGEKERKLQSEQTPAWRAAMEKIGDGPLFRMLYHTRIYRSNRYPMAKADWAYVTNEGDIYLNPHRKASAGEWEYIISIVCCIWASDISRKIG